MNLKHPFSRIDCGIQLLVHTVCSNQPRGGLANA
jgi:hypothetical protein